LCYIPSVRKLEISNRPEEFAKRGMPLIVAHRGARREAPENTLPAIERAVELRADGVEFDVLLTQDKVPIVTHNDDLSVLTHHRGYAHSTPFATIRSLDVGSHFNASFSGVTMPTLAEALELLEHRDMLTIVEIKPQPSMAISAAELIGGIVADFRMKGRIVLSSSSLRVLYALKRRHPELTRAFIARRAFLSFAGSTILNRPLGISELHCSLTSLSPESVSRVQRRGGGVLAWTANTPDEMDHCIALNVDGIITDDTAFARRHLEENLGMTGR